MDVRQYFTDDDIFGLCFDFSQDEMLIYHNNMMNALDKISLHDRKSLIMAVSLTYDLTSDNNCSIGCIL